MLQTQLNGGSDRARPLASCCLNRHRLREGDTWRSPSSVRRALNAPLGARVQLDRQRRRRMRPWHYGARHRRGARRRAASRRRDRAHVLERQPDRRRRALAKHLDAARRRQDRSINVTGRDGGVIPVDLRGDPTIWPTARFPAHERVTITVVDQAAGLGLVAHRLDRAAAPDPLTPEREACARTT